MTCTKLQIIKDINGIPTYALPQSDYIYTGLLTANTAQSVTAPSDAARYLVRVGVSNGADIFVSVNGTATVPTGAPALSTTEVNIAQTYVGSGSTVSVITTQDSVKYSLGFYECI